jgi:ribonuclease J
MALEYENDIIIMDMGFMFPGPDLPGVDYVIPDTTYLERNKHKIRGHLITHAHLDHIGAIPFILPKIPAPIFGANFTIKFIERQLEEYRLPFKPDLRIVSQDSREKIQLGVFSIEFVRVNHSIPDACALAIHTPVGVILNTGDWRFDPDPYDGKPANKQRLKQLGDEGVLMLMCDSTSCEHMGKSPREQEITETLDDIFIRNYNRRIIISSFSSQVSRMQMIIDAIARAKRKMIIVGRSILSNVELAVKMGYIKIPPGLIIKAGDADKYQDSEIAILATGSQGEDLAVLNRIGRGEHKDIKIKKTDIVVLSSSIIPGNEKDVWSMIDNILRWGPYVYTNSLREFDDLGIMHISGHAYYEEIVEMIELVRPKYYLPIHGELHHMVHNAQIAKRTGVIDDKNIFVIENGQTLVADKSGIKLGPIVPSGSVLVDGSGVGDVQSIVLKDRLSMASEGIFVAIATVNKKTGRLSTSPDIISRGFIYMKDNEEVINKARKIIKNIFEKRHISTPANSLIVKTRMRDELSSYLYKETKRNPIVIPVVIEA